MEKLGINIEYADIEDMVNEIKEEDKVYNEVFFKEPSYEKSASLINIMDIMEQLKGVPVAAVGAVSEKNEEFTFVDIENDFMSMGIDYQSLKGIISAFYEAGKYESVIWQYLVTNYEMYKNVSSEYIEIFNALEPRFNLN